MTTSESISREELNRMLYSACDILRGPINQDEYKAYLTPLLFFKRLSDVYDEETENALEESGGDEEYAALPDNHSFAIPEGCHWNDVREKTSDVGKAIIDAMMGIERANPDSFGGLFSSFDETDWANKSILDDERLKNLVEHFSQQKLGNKHYSADMMGDAYEYLIKHFADMSKQNAAEFYTPREIVKLMVRLLKPLSGETVYDPACGTGGMLIEAIRNMDDERLSYGRVFGQENNLSTSAIARMNLFLHGARDFRIVQGDTLRSPQLVDGERLMTFDCVLANPPFSLKHWGAEQFESDKYGRNLWGVPTEMGGADWAWLQHMVCSMDEKGGRCAVILPQGVLFHGGREGKMREGLVKADILECVITLASGVFYSTGVSACILFLSNRKHIDHKGKVCLIDGSKIYTAKRAQNYISDADADRLYGLYEAYEDEIEFCKIATIEEIEGQGCTLQVSNYIEQPKKDSESPEAVKARFLDLLDRADAGEQAVRELLRKGGYLDAE